MIGDLPDADVAPDVKSLFVCQLNAVTTDDDLKLIFTRFGPCECEIIKDAVTGESLNYAFVTYESTKAAEDAYFKMNNALIDDRRIRVDFSQSVAKLSQKGNFKLQRRPQESAANEQRTLFVF